VHRDSRIKKVLAVGGTFKLPGLQKYLQQNLQLDVERLDTITAAPSAESKLAPNFNENILSVVTAYGLAIQAMGQSKVTSSLLPAKIRREKMWKEKTPLFGAAAALFVAGLGVSVGTWWLNSMSLNSGSAQAANAKVAQVLSEATPLDQQWTEVEGATAGSRQKIINIQGLLEYRTLWPKLISDIQSALPQSIKPQFGSLDPAKLKSTPRNKREVVLIDNMISDYRPDITQLLTAEDIRVYASTAAGMPPTNLPTPAAGENGGAPAEPTAATPRGFILTIHCTTPFVNGGDLIQKQFIPALLNIKPNAADKDKKYQIVKAQIVQPLMIREDSTRVAKMREDYTKALQAATAQNNVQVNIGGGGPMSGGGDMGPGYGGGYRGPDYMPAPAMPMAAAAAPGQPDDSAPFADRATGEDMRDDWEVTVVALVQLDPPPPAPPAAPAGQ
jgi:hypothetical protein